MKNHQFTIYISKDEKGWYIARVPSLPGCHTYAKTLPELYKRAEEAISLCLEVQAEDEWNDEKFVGIQQMDISYS